jgi:hypothetical protein
MRTYSAGSMVSVAKSWFNLALSLVTAPAVGITIALLVAGTPVRGQTPAIPSEPKLNLTLEQRHVVKEIIKDLDISPAQQNVETTVGATVPATINLNPMPPVVAQKVPQVKSHLFFLKDGKVVIVDPKENKIVDAIE